MRKHKEPVIRAAGVGELRSRWPRGGLNYTEVVFASAEHVGAPLKAGSGSRLLPRLSPPAKGS